MSVIYLKHKIHGTARLCFQTGVIICLACLVTGSGQSDSASTMHSSELHLSVSDKNEYRTDYHNIEIHSTRADQLLSSNLKFGDSTYTTEISYTTTQHVLSAQSVIIESPIVSVDTTRHDTLNSEDTELFVYSESFYISTSYMTEASMTREQNSMSEHKVSDLTYTKSSSSSSMPTASKSVLSSLAGIYSDTYLDMDIRTTHVNDVSDISVTKKESEVNTTFILESTRPNAITKYDSPGFLQIADSSFIASSTMALPDVSVSAQSTIDARLKLTTLQSSIQSSISEINLAISMIDLTSLDLLSTGSFTIPPSYDIKKDTTVNLSVPSSTTSEQRNIRTSDTEFSFILPSMDILSDERQLYLSDTLVSSMSEERKDTSNDFYSTVMLVKESDKSVFPTRKQDVKYTPDSKHSSSSSHNLLTSDNLPFSETNLTNNDGNLSSIDTRENVDTFQIAKTHSDTSSPGFLEQYSSSLLSSLPVQAKLETQINSAVSSGQHKSSPQLLPEPSERNTFTTSSYTPPSNAKFQQTLFLESLKYQSDLDTEVGNVYPLSSIMIYSSDIQSELSTAQLTSEDLMSPLNNVTSVIPNSTDGILKQTTLLINNTNLHNPHPNTLEILPYAIQSSDFSLSLNSSVLSNLNVNSAKLEISGENGSVRFQESYSDNISEHQYYRKHTSTPPVLSPTLTFSTIIPIYDGSGLNEPISESMYIRSTITVPNLETQLTSQHEHSYMLTLSKPPGIITKHGLDSSFKEDVTLQNLRPSSYNLYSSFTSEHFLFSNFDETPLLPEETYSSKLIQSPHISFPFKSLMTKLTVSFISEDFPLSNSTNTKRVHDTPAKHILRSSYLPETLSDTPLKRFTSTLTMSSHFEKQDYLNTDSMTETTSSAELFPIEINSSHILNVSTIASVIVTPLTAVNEMYIKSRNTYLESKLPNSSNKQLFSEQKSEWPAYNGVHSQIFYHTIDAVLNTEHLKTFIHSTSAHFALSEHENELSVLHDVQTLFSGEKNTFSVITSSTTHTVKESSNLQLVSKSLTAVESSYLYTNASTASSHGTVKETITHLVQDKVSRTLNKSSSIASSVKQSNVLYASFSQILSENEDTVMHSHMSISSSNPATLSESMYFLAPKITHALEYSSSKYVSSVLVEDLSSIQYTSKSQSGNEKYSSFSVSDEYASYRIPFPTVVAEPVSSTSILSVVFSDVHYLPEGQYTRSEATLDQNIDHLYSTSTSITSVNHNYSSLSESVKERPSPKLFTSDTVRKPSSTEQLFSISTNALEDNSLIKSTAFSSNQPSQTVSTKDIVSVIRETVLPSAELSIDHHTIESAFISRFLELLPSSDSDEKLVQSDQISSHITTMPTPSLESEVIMYTSEISTSYTLPKYVDFTSSFAAEVSSPDEHLQSTRTLFVTSASYNVATPVIAPLSTSFSSRFLELIPYSDIDEILVQSDQLSNHIATFPTPSLESEGLKYTSKVSNSNTLPQNEDFTSSFVVFSEKSLQSRSKLLVTSTINNVATSVIAPLSTSQAYVAYKHTDMRSKSLTMADVLPTLNRKMTLSSKMILREFSTETIITHSSNTGWTTSAPHTYASNIHTAVPSKLFTMTKVLPILNRKETLSSSMDSSFSSARLKGITHFSSTEWATSASQQYASNIQIHIPSTDVLPTLNRKEILSSRADSSFSSVRLNEFSNETPITHSSNTDWTTSASHVYASNTHTAMPSKSVTMVKVLPLLNRKETLSSSMDSSFSSVRLTEFSTATPITYSNSTDWTTSASSHYLTVTNNSNVSIPISSAFDPKATLSSLIFTTASISDASDESIHLPVLLLPPATSSTISPDEFSIDTPTAHSISADLTIAPSHYLTVTQKSNVYIPISSAFDPTTSSSSSIFISASISEASEVSIYLPDSYLPPAYTTTISTEEFSTETPIALSSSTEWPTSASSHYFTDAKKSIISIPISSATTKTLIFTTDSISEASQTSIYSYVSLLPPAYTSTLLSEEFSTATPITDSNSTDWTTSASSHYLTVTNNSNFSIPISSAFDPKATLSSLIFTTASISDASDESIHLPVLLLPPATSSTISPDEFSIDTPTAHSISADLAIAPSHYLTVTQKSNVYIPISSAFDPTTSSSSSIFTTASISEASEVSIYLPDSYLPPAYTSTISTEEFSTETPIALSSSTEWPTSASSHYFTDAKKSIISIPISSATTKTLIFTTDSISEASQTSIYSYVSLLPPAYTSTLLSEEYSTETSMSHSITTDSTTSVSSHYFTVATQSIVAIPISSEFDPPSPTSTPIVTTTSISETSQKSMTLPASLLLPTSTSTILPVDMNLLIVDVQVKETVDERSGYFRQSIQKGLLKCYRDGLERRAKVISRPIQPRVTNNKDHDVSIKIKVTQIQRNKVGTTVVHVTFFVIDDGRLLTGSTAVAIFDLLSLLESSALIGYPVTNKVASFITEPKKTPPLEQPFFTPVTITIIIVPFSCAAIAAVIVVYVYFWKPKRDGNTKKQPKRFSITSLRKHALKDFDLVIDVESATADQKTSTKPHDSKGTSNVENVCDGKTNSIPMALLHIQSEKPNKECCPKLNDQQTSVSRKNQTNEANKDRLAGINHLIMLNQNKAWEKKKSQTKVFEYSHDSKMNNRSCTSNFTSQVSEHDIDNNYNIVSRQTTSKGNKKDFENATMNIDTEGERGHRVIKTGVQNMIPTLTKNESYQAISEISTSDNEVSDTESFDSQEAYVSDADIDDDIVLQRVGEKQYAGKCIKESDSYDDIMKQLRERSPLKEIPNYSFKARRTQRRTSFRDDNLEGVGRNGDPISYRELPRSRRKRHGGVEIVSSTSNIPTEGYCNKVLQEPFYSSLTLTKPPRRVNNFIEGDIEDEVFLPEDKVSNTRGYRRNVGKPENTFGENNHPLCNEQSTSVTTGDRRNAELSPLVQTPVPDYCVPWDLFGFRFDKLLRKPDSQSSDGSEYAGDEFETVNFKTAYKSPHSSVSGHPKRKLSIKKQNIEHQNKKMTSKMFAVDQNMFERVTKMSRVGSRQQSPNNKGDFGPQFRPLPFHEIRIPSTRGSTPPVTPAEGSTRPVTPAESFREEMKLGRNMRAAPRGSLGHPTNSYANSVDMFEGYSRNQHITSVKEVADNHTQQQPHYQQQQQQQQHNKQQQQQQQHHREEVKQRRDETLQKMKNCNIDIHAPNTDNSGLFISRQSAFASIPSKGNDASQHQREDQLFDAEVLPSSSALDDGKTSASKNYLTPSSTSAAAVSAPPPAAADLYYRSPDKAASSTGQGSTQPFSPRGSAAFNSGRETSSHSLLMATADDTGSSRRNNMTKQETEDDIEDIEEDLEIEQDTGKERMSDDDF